MYLVEDDPAVALSLSALLRADRLEVHHFTSADSFLAAVGSLKPGCVLTDIHMAGTTGITGIQELRARDIQWPVTQAVQTRGDDPGHPPGDAARSQRIRGVWDDEAAERAGELNRLDAAQSAVGRRWLSCGNLLTSSITACACEFEPS